MAKEGFWMIRYRGAAGEGIGLLAFDTGVIAGVEILGGTLDGSFVYDVRKNVLRSNIVWTAGDAPGFLAQTGEAIQSGMTLSVQVDLPNDLQNDTPVEIETEKGLLYVTFRKIRNFPS